MASVHDWKPSSSYKHDLRTIATQFTPSEHYRYRLKTSGPEIRRLQNLEFRWRNNFEVWTLSTLRIQCVFRGKRGRDMFMQIKEDLRINLLQRRLVDIINAAYLDKRYGDVFENIKLLPRITDDMYLIKFRSMYAISKYLTCVEEISYYLGKD